MYNIISAVTSYLRNLIRNPGSHPTQQNQVDSADYRPPVGSNSSATIRLRDKSSIISGEEGEDGTSGEYEIPAERTLHVLTLPLQRCVSDAAGSLLLTFECSAHMFSTCYRPKLGGGKTDGEKIGRKS
ncbi:hypothetical protein Baya_11550 [Bagarius yarrelli]|uniref:Uncharacterized protein n=1 Tax=Bagarius yarrelli TaxID=175774 RepID=A0A556UZY8_BAGYA|nr:hypothetical protein Baya_11550 [Bagarius yarrelli]